MSADHEAALPAHGPFLRTWSIWSCGFDCCQPKLCRVPLHPSLMDDFSTTRKDGNNYGK